ncbi:glycosyltransferase family 39 protein [Streptomyces sp. NPDC019937]|uniref:glycosyltransferase family 39 protein n=1 Tax=Streptomyces sp. NPDC019937 TaxID=3154787 RepID=UPI0033DB800A
MESRPSAITVEAGDSRALRCHRLRAAARDAAPAVLGFAMVRAVGVAVLLYWGHRRGDPALGRLATIWDAERYGNIAMHGYDRGLPVLATSPQAWNAYSNLAFFPLYPALIRLVHALTSLPVPHAALLVSWLASLTAAWGIFAVAAWRYGRHTGVLAAVLWGALPHAVVESMAYTEALFTALAAWSLYAALTQRWIWAGVLCALAGLTRPSGMALVVAIDGAAAVALVRIRRRPARQPAKARWQLCLGAVIAPLGWLGFVTWVGTRLGHWDGYFAVQKLWRSRFDWGVTTVRQLVRVFLHATSVPFAWVVVALVLCAAIALGAVTVAHGQPLPLVAYSVGLLVIAVGDSAFFGARARFLLPAFPLLLPLAIGLARVRSGSVRVLLLGSTTALSALYGAYLVFAVGHAP